MRRAITAVMSHRGPEADGFHFDAGMATGDRRLSIIDLSTGDQPPLDRALYVDVQTYPVDDIMTKVDRMSMAVSLDAREPLLDHRLLEFAATVPTRLKLRNGRSKSLLRRLLERRVPRPIVDRPTRGFEAPVGEWLGGPLTPSSATCCSTVGGAGAASSMNAPLFGCGASTPLAPRITRTGFGVSSARALVQAGSSIAGLPPRLRVRHSCPREKSNVWDCRHRQR
jgi:asparagine synthase